MRHMQLSCGVACPNSASTRSWPILSSDAEGELDMIFFITGGAICSWSDILQKVEDGNAISG